MFMAYVITGVGNLGMTLVYSMIRWPSLLQTLQDYYMVYTTSLSSGTVWLCIVVLAVIALLPDLLIRVHRDTTNRIAESTNRRRKFLWYLFYPFSFCKRKLPANKLSVSFTKRSGTLTLSQVELAEDF
nr:uncharacterized protein LOC111136210 isoform X3 [Crassostrea virginica]